MDPILYYSLASVAILIAISLLFYSCYQSHNNSEYILLSDDDLWPP